MKMAKPKKDINPVVSVGIQIGNLGKVGLEVDLERASMRYPFLAVGWMAYQVVCRIKDAEAEGVWL